MRKRSDESVLGGNPEFSSLDTVLECSTTSSFRFLWGISHKILHTLQSRIGYLQSAHPRWTRGLASLNICIRWWSEGCCATGHNIHHLTINNCSLPTYNVDRLYVEGCVLVGVLRVV